MLVINATFLSMTNQNQEGVELLIQSTVVKEKLILAVIDNSVIYNLTLKAWPVDHLEKKQKP